MHNIEDLFSTIKHMVAVELNISAEEVFPESVVVDDLGADSLDILVLYMDLEEEFGINIPDEELKNIHTIQEIVSYVGKNISAKNPNPVDRQKKNI